MLVKRQHTEKAMKNGLETENWVCEARVEELEKKKLERNVFEALLVYEKTLPSPGLGMALSSGWKLYWPKLCSPSPRACGCLAPSLSPHGVSRFLSREFPFSWLFQSMLERKQDIPLSHHRRESSLGGLAAGRGQGSHSRALYA